MPKTTASRRAASPRAWWAIGPLLYMLGTTPAHATAAAQAPTVAERGDEAFEQGDYREAIRMYRASYDMLPREERASYIGSFPVRDAMRAYDALYEQGQDIVVLQEQYDFVDEFLREVQQHGGDLDEVTATSLANKRDAIRQQLDARAAQTPPAPAPIEDPAAEDTADEDEAPPTKVGPDEPPPEPARGDQAPVPATPTRDRLGIGLAAGGGTVLVVGGALATGWWSVNRQAEDFADRTMGYELGTQERENYLAREEDRARKWLISGAVLGSVGLVTTIAGVTHIVLHRRRARAKTDSMAIVPQLAPTSFGLAMAGRF